MIEQHPSLADLLVRHRDDLLAYVRRRGSGLLRFESDESLVQGVHLRALEHEHTFDYRSQKEFFGWLYTLARAHIGDRNDHWSTMKRGCQRVVRLTFSGVGDAMDHLPAPTRTGASTIAVRRELLSIATRAMSALPPRDRDLVRWMSEGVSLTEQARRLELSAASAQKAGLRALERLRKTYRLISQQPPA